MVTELPKSRDCRERSLSKALLSMEHPGDGGGSEQGPVKRNLWVDMRYMLTS